MSRTASGGITASSLRSQAQAQFPGKTAVIFRLGKSELLEAIETGVLPTGNTGNGIVTRTAIMPSGGIVDNHNLAISQFALALETLTQDCIRPVSESDVRAIVSDMLAGMPAAAGAPQSLSITINDLPTVTLSAQHKQFAVLLALCTARVNTMLVGPAGSGKTSAGHAVASALRLAYRALSVGPQTSKSDLLGYMDATGTYRGTAVREMYENGGILLLDELDAGNAGVLTQLNALLANGEMTFPDMTVRKHKDFICIAAANTYGQGASREYVGRNQLDAATLDRFFVLEWTYDESFEAALLGLRVSRDYVTLRASGHTIESWYRRVTSVRKSVETCKIRHMVSPRASFYGAKLLDVMPVELLEEGLIWKGMPAIQRTQIEGGIR